MRPCRHTRVGLAGGGALENSDSYAVCTMKREHFYAPEVLAIVVQNYRQWNGIIMSLRIGKYRWIV